MCIQEKTLTCQFTQTQTCTRSCSPAHLHREHKKHGFLVLGYCKGVQQPWQIYRDRRNHCFTYRLFYWWSNGQPSSSGELQCTVENSVLELSTLSFNIRQAVKSVSAPPPSDSPVGGHCATVLIINPWTWKNKRGRRWTAWTVPRSLMEGGGGGGGYTPSSMPMKSEPFCIVMEAPAALSTKMEVYCPACRGHTNNTEAAGTQICSVSVSVGVFLTWSSSSPCTLTVKILLLLSSPTIISKELRSKYKQQLSVKSVMMSNWQALEPCSTLGHVQGAQCQDIYNSQTFLPELVPIPAGIRREVGYNPIAGPTYRDKQPFTLMWRDPFWPYPQTLP